MQEEKLAGHACVDLWVPILEGTPIPPRRRMLSPIQEAQTTKQALEWKSQGYTEIIPNPPYVNNLVLVAKKDGRIRVCVDATPANDVTKDFDWPLPRLQDLRHFVKGAQWFLRIDLKDAFLRIRIPFKYRHLTAFHTGGITYQFKRMIFGLKTAPSTFQRFMDWGLSEYIGWAFWYIDDILIKASTKAELEARVKTLRMRLVQMGCRVNEEKSTGPRSSLLFAGLWVMGKGIGPNLLKLKEILAVPLPRTKADAQSALGLVSYLRDFIPLVSHFTAMLYPDKQGFRLSAEEYESQWNALLRHLSHACSINHHWVEGTPADVYTDASLFGLGVLVLQEGRVVALASRKLTGAETRYSATDREHLGLVYAAERFKVILHQSTSNVRVWSDHSALLSRKSDGMLPRQARWQELVKFWIPNLSHVKGKCNPADFISRWRISEVGAEIRA